ncbi:hypothetical protein IF1G_04817 [Cordyceps javanica]|uniref:Uncharacterized protein n=1 Tax=Cordyceps javanica TaxID=43265 RepID=A0A545V3E8_9HYPO|nr:hypothetical protein IF1G_04817 [Cordyceps javanica]
MYLETSRHHMSLMQVSSAGRLFGVCPGRDKAGYASVTGRLSKSPNRKLGVSHTWSECCLAALPLSSRFCRNDRGSGGCKCTSSLASAVALTLAALVLVMGGFLLCQLSVLACQSTAVSTAAALL